MVFRCPRGTEKGFRFRKGTSLRLGGCLDKYGNFQVVKEVKKIPGGKRK